VLPVAGIDNARWTDRLRARARHARREVRGSLALSTLVVASAVGVAQSVSLFAIHGVLPSPVMLAVVAIVLASLACLWVGTFAFVRLVTGRGGCIAGIATTLAFYGLAMPLGTDDTVITIAGLLPAALACVPLLVRMPWPTETPRPSLPCA
jgi:hypothetical protein